MRMRIDPAGNDQLPCRVDHRFRLNIQRLPDGRYRLAIDKNISNIVVNRGNNSSVFDQCSHSILFKLVAFVGSRLFYRLQVL